MGKNKLSVEQQQAELRHTLLELEVAAAEMLEEAVNALIYQNVAQAERVLARKSLVHCWEAEVREQGQRLICRRSLTPSQSREILASMAISRELAQVAQQSAAIGQLAQQLSREAIYKPLIDLPQLTERVLDLLRHTLDHAIRQGSGAILSERTAQAQDACQQMRQQLLVELDVDHRSTWQAVYLLLALQTLSQVVEHCCSIGGYAIARKQ